VETALTNDWPYDVIVQVASYRVTQTSGDNSDCDERLVIWMTNLHAVLTGDVWTQEAGWEHLVDHPGNVTPSLVELRGSFQPLRVVR